MKLQFHEFFFKSAIFLQIKRFVKLQFHQKFRELAQLRFFFFKFFSKDEDNPKNVVPGNQFTFRIQDLYQARFWYISLVACRRNTTTVGGKPPSCKWDYVSDFEGTIQYDIR